MGMPIPAVGATGVGGAAGSAPPLPAPSAPSSTPPAAPITGGGTAITSIPVVAKPLPDKIVPAPVKDAVAGAAGGPTQGGSTDAVGGAAGLAGMAGILAALKDLLVKLTDLLKAMASPGQTSTVQQGGGGVKPPAQPVINVPITQQSTSSDTSGGGAAAAPAPAVASVPAANSNVDTSRSALLTPIAMPTDGSQLSTTDPRAQAKYAQIQAYMNGLYHIDMTGMQ